MIGYRVLLACLLFVMAVGGISCRYSSKSGLPTHIKTVDVEMFKNRSFYKGLEAKLTKYIVEKANLRPGIRVVNSGGDASISGTILTVTNQVTRSDSEGTASSVQVNITVEYSFRDNVEQRMVFENEQINNSASSSRNGEFDIDRGEARTSAESAALEEVARVLVDQTLGMW